MPAQRCEGKVARSKVGWPRDIEGPASRYEFSRFLARQALAKAATEPGVSQSALTTRRCSTRPSAHAFRRRYSGTWN